MYDNIMIIRSLLWLQINSFSQNLNWKIIKFHKSRTKNRLNKMLFCHIFPSKLKRLTDWHWLFCSSSKKRKTLADHIANFPSVANEVRLDDSRPSLEDEPVEYQNLESEVKFLLELRNMTEWRMWPDQTYIHWGYITSPPTGLR